jgi:hypothetical protein
MAVQDQVFSLVEKVISVISLKNVAIWTLAGLVAITGFTVYENRAAIVKTIINGPGVEVPTVSTFTVSDTSKARVKQIVDTDDLINAIIILNADIRNNRRVPLYWYSDELSLQKAIDTMFGGRYGGIPLFTSDEKNNENIVGIINGEFTCQAYADGGNAAIFPGLSLRMPFICRTSLPPYYGQFSGYIAVTLNRIPNENELAIIKSETLNISTEIYFRDVLPNSKKLISATR